MCDREKSKPVRPEYIDSGMYIERLFPALGVLFIVINDLVDTVGGDQDDIILPFKNLINDAYCRDISIKIRSDLAVKRKNGEYVGAFVVYGYMKSKDDPHKIIPDPYAAGVVQDIFRMKLNGYSQNTIADRLNEQGVLYIVEYKHSIGIKMTDNFKTHEQSMCIFHILLPIGNNNEPCCNVIRHFEFQIQYLQSIYLCSPLTCDRRL